MFWYCWLIGCYWTLDLFNRVLLNTWSVPRMSGVLPWILHKITSFIWRWRRKQRLPFQRQKTWAEKIEILCSPELGTELPKPRPQSWGFMVLDMRGYMFNEMTFLFVCVCMLMRMYARVCVCVAKGDGSQNPSLFIYLFVYLPIYLLFCESGPLPGLNITNQVKLRLQAHTTIPNIFTPINLNSCDHPPVSRN